MNEQNIKIDSVMIVLIGTCIGIIGGILVRDWTAGLIFSVIAIIVIYLIRLILEESTNE